MFEIDNFAAGIIPNAAWSGFRNVAAMDASDVRVDPNGFLVQRDGHRVVYDDASVSQVFAYQTLLIAVIGNRLQWARAQGRGRTVVFRDFANALDINTDAPYHFQPIETAAHAYILVGNGMGDPTRHQDGPYVIDLEDTFDPASPKDPTLHRFYLVDPSAPYGLQRREVNQDIVTNYHDKNHVQLFFQAVRTTESQDGVPWIRDFTIADQPLPTLAPTVAVSKAVPALGSAGVDPFTVTYSPINFGGGNSSSEYRFRVSSLIGTNVGNYLSFDTNDPAKLTTVGGPHTYLLAGGQFSGVMDIVNTPSREPRTVRLRFEVSVDNAATWRELGSVRRFGIGDRPFTLEYETVTLGRLAPSTTIRFRFRVTRGSVRLTSPPSLRFSTDNAFEILTAAFDSIPENKRDIYADQPRTELTFRLNLPVPDAADYVDVYRSRRRDPPAPYARGYVLMARLPHQDTLQFTLKFPVTDDVLPNLWVDALPEQGEVVSWRYADVDAYRMYAIVPDENRLYLSHFNGIAERRFMNLVDFVHLPTAGEPITAVKFLSDTYLAVYTSHRILMVYTDPAAELTRVTGQFSQGSGDEAVGCIAPRSLVGLDGYHYFLSANKRVYRFGGRRPVWASSSVQPILEPLRILESEDADIEFANAVGVAYKGGYYLSFPTMTQLAVHALVWQGSHIEWRDHELDWKASEASQHSPNSTLIFDVDRGKWYRDGFGVQSYTKDARDWLYGVVRGNIMALYDDPSPEPFLWFWHSNFMMLPSRTVIFNVCVKTQIAVDMVVTVRTEEGVQTQDISARDANDYWGQYAGVNLRGRTVRVQIAGRGRTTIDRISINERV